MAWLPEGEFWTEAGFEAARPFAAFQSIRRSVPQDTEPHQLRVELVTNVHRRRGSVLEVQPYLLDGMIGPD